MKLELRKFDPRSIKDDSVCIFLAKRNSGKTVALTHVLSSHMNIPIGVVISPTEQMNKHFSNYIPGMLIYDEYDPKILQKFVDRQLKIAGQYTNEKERYGHTDIDPRAFLILDDCLYDKTWPTDKNIRQLFMNGRHMKVFMCITMQFPLGIPPVLRTNVDYVFILRETNIANRHRIYQQYAGIFPSFETFNDVLNQCTEDFECMVINNKTQSNKIEDQVFWWKADPGIQFKMCSKDLWDMQALENQRKLMGISTVDEDDEEDYNPNLIVKKKNATKIKVCKNY